MKKIVRPHASPRLIDRINRDEVRQRGRIVAIEPKSGDYFIASTSVGALRKARERHPEATFVFKRIGFRWTHRQAGGLRTVSR